MRVEPSVQGGKIPFSLGIDWQGKGRSMWRNARIIEPEN